MSTKRTGNSGEAHALTELVDLGFGVYPQWGDNEPADLIAVINNKCVKIQVKTSTRFDGDKTTFDMISSTTHRKNGVKHKYTTEEVDIFICYDAINDKSYIVRNTGELTKFTVRYALPQNGDTSSINYFAEYLMTKDRLEQIANTLG